MLSWLSQIATVSWHTIRTLGERRWASAAAAFGIAAVVGVFVAVLSIGEGFRKTLITTAARDNAIVLRSGSDSEMMSGIERDDTRIIAEASGVKRGFRGPISSAEIFVIVDLPMRSTGTDANVPLRGVQPGAFEVRDKVKIVEGRSFAAGRNEVIVGRAAAAQFAGLDLGAKLRMGENEWTVVGIFTAEGGLSESEIWADVGVLQPAYRRGSVFQAVYVKLESEQAFDKFKDALTTDPRLDIKVMRESDYYAEQSRMITGMITGLGGAITFLMAIGAVFGALNTMYSAVSSRSREIATLRALGFKAGPVVISVLTESIVLALTGGAVGAAVAYFFFNGIQAATMNWSSFSQVAFAFAVTPRLLIMGIIWALVMGVVGGLFPAIRAARLPVATALREQ